MANDMKVTWWQWLPFLRWRIVGEAQSVDEIPQRLPRNGIALVPKPGGLKWLVFDCPCRTGHRIMLNADASRKPYWRLDKKIPPSIAPSVDYRGNDRRCHYFIRNGRTVWTKDNSR
jgi:Family of unknown function (DUF6527)